MGAGEPDVRRRHHLLSANEGLHPFLADEALRLVARAVSLGYLAAKLRHTARE